MSINAEFEDIANVVAPPYVCRNADVKLNMTALGRFVIKDESTGMYVATKLAILPAKDLEHDPAWSEANGDSKPFVAVGDEHDISRRLGNAARPTFTLPTGVAWTNGEMISLYCFDDAVVEYRKSIGVPSTTVSSITGLVPTYMVTYASVGIPRERFMWLIEYLAAAGLTVVRNERDQEHNDYVFFNTNITRGYSVPFLVKLPDGSLRQAGTEKHNLMTAMRNIGKNVLGVVGLEIGLKRSKDFTDGNRTYLLSPSLKMVQMYDTTDIGSPPLVKAVTFAASDRGTATKLLQALSGRKDEDGTDSTTSSAQLVGKRTPVSDPV